MMHCEFVDLSQLRMPTSPTVADALDSLLSTLKLDSSSLIGPAPKVDELLLLLEHQGRPTLLASLKAFGVAKLGDRQAVANALGRLLREGTLEIPEAEESALEAGQTDFGFDPYIYAETLVPPERALRGRARREMRMGQLKPHRILGTSLLPPWDPSYRRAVFAAGCFWGLEKGLWRLPGVHSTAAGYACGFTPNPTYSEVCTGLTGHTEAVLVVYDPQRLSFADLLRWFWECHDPCQGYGQGKDRGTQYRSAILTFDEECHALALASRDAYQRALATCGRYFTSRQTITVDIPHPHADGAGESGCAPFYYAEEEHMQYLARPESSPYCTAQPLLVSLPPYAAWAPAALHDAASLHAPKLPDTFWAKHAPVEHCALRRPNEPIAWPISTTSELSMEQAMELAQDVLRAGCV